MGKLDGKVAIITGSTSAFILTKLCAPVMKAKGEGHIIFAPKYLNPPASFRSA